MGVGIGRGERGREWGISGEVGVSWRSGSVLVVIVQCIVNVEKDKGSGSGVKAGWRGLCALRAHAGANGR